MSDEKPKRLLRNEIREHVCVGPVLPANHLEIGIVSLSSQRLEFASGLLIPPEHPMKPKRTVAVALQIKHWCVVNAT